MKLDDEICLCFHVTKRKLLSFIRVEKPRRASQLSECFGAGTGCGWCRPFLKRCYEQSADGQRSAGKEPTSAQYAQLRARYIHTGGGTPPPGATPIEDPPEQPG